MHDHIKKTVEDLLNMMYESIALYKSVKPEELHGMGPNTLNSIIQSKENSAASLLKEFNRIYPQFKPKDYPTNPQSINTIYNSMLSLENRIASFVQSDLLPNIPSKGHEGIYTLAANIRSNSESTVVKLNNMLNLRGDASASYDNIVGTLLPLIEALEVYEKEDLPESAALCIILMEHNKKTLKEKFSKNLTIYSPGYGESFASISSKFNIKLPELLKLNNLTNPYSRVLSKYLIIITD
jgi:hypothetical protein